MLPVLLGAAAAGGLASYFGNKNKNAQTRDAYGRLTGVANDAADAEMATASQFNSQNRLNFANQLRQDANAYETNAAIQGGLSAFGGNPLSGGAHNAVYDRLQQNARQNYQASLDNANNMMGTDLQAQLGIKQRLTDNKFKAAGAQADAAAAQKSGASAFMGGAGQALSLGSKIMGMG